MTDGEGRRVEASDGVHIWWDATGPEAGEPLLLVHSLGLDSAMWAPQAEALANTHRVIVLDLRGHGRSDAPSGPYTIERLALDVLDVADAAGAERFHLCGLSIGGQVALWLALERPDRLRSLVLANTSARIGSAETWAERISAVEGGGMAPIAPTVLRRWFSADFEAREPAWYAYARERLLTTSPGGYVGCCAALAASDLRARVGEVAAPTLVIGGSEDVPTPSADARALHEAITGSELVIIDGAAHISNLDAEQALTSRILGFLS